uniref:Ig-like domain-containing protein n=2 Tax=Oryzias melastigma TaxID=30732 RepID=A0A3B3DQY3_ORYME
MASKFFVFFLTCLLVGTNGQRIYLKSSSSVPQKNVFFSVNVGQAVTLECSSENQNSRRIFWYKQSLGKNPELISSFYVYDTEVTFYGEFKNNPRFILDMENQNHHLQIFNLQFSDSATYNCVSHGSYTLTFLKSYTIHVKDASFYLRESVDLLSMQEAAWTRDSVTLNCTVHTGSCDGEHRVYWFKDSEDSHPGLIYTDGGRNDQCERNNNTKTHSCFYELPIENLNDSHVRIYCAVVSCGHILFGKMDLKGELYVLVVFLLFLLWRINKRNNCTSTGTQTYFTAENKDTESLHYAAMNVKRSNRSRRQKNDINTECVYTSVRQQI